MSLESSIEALAGALQAHAGAIEKLATAMAASRAANAEQFDRTDRQTPAERERDEAVKLTGIPVAPGEDPSEPPFEAPAKAAKTATNAESKSAPVAEQAAAAKISEEKPKAFSLEDARRKATQVLKLRGADKLRSLLDAIGVKKLSALSEKQIQTFCANAEQALQEA